MVSMHDYAVQCYTMSGGKEMPVQTGHDLPQTTVYGVFPARDGNLVIAAQVDDAWKRLARLIGGDALAADTRFHNPAGRNAHREEMLAKVREWTLAQPSVKAARARSMPPRSHARRCRTSTRCWPIRRSSRAA